jgi:hypothetical protein
MMAPTLNRTSQSRWMDWKPSVRVSAGREPTKPSKLGSVSFDGKTPKSPEVEAGPDPTELGRAASVLNRAGARILRVFGAATIGLWSDLDGPELRAALRVLELQRLPIRYLDGDGIPTQYKLRRVEGEPVPKSVLAQMERRPADPWRVRDGC